MKGRQLGIFATSADMLGLCKEFEDSIGFRYAFVENHKHPKVIVSHSAAEIDLFWTSPHGFIGRSLLLIPAGYQPQARETELSGGNRSYSLNPADVERCVILQEGGIFAQDDCLIAGSLANTFSDEWSKNTFNAISKITKKRFSKICSYYLGAEAKQRFQDGYRLTFQSIASRHYDLSCAEVVVKK